MINAIMRAIAPRIPSDPFYNFFTISVGWAYERSRSADISQRCAVPWNAGLFFSDVASPATFVNIFPKL